MEDTQASRTGGGGTANGEAEAHPAAAVGAAAAADVSSLAAATAGAGRDEAPDSDCGNLPTRERRALEGEGAENPGQARCSR